MFGAGTAWVGRMPDVLGGNIFLGAWVRADRRSTIGDYQDWKSDITGGAILETLLGPVFFGGSVGFQGGGRFYISLRAVHSKIDGNTVTNLNHALRIWRPR